MTSCATMPRAKPRPPAPGDLVRVCSLDFIPSRSDGELINLGLVLRKVRHARRPDLCHFQVLFPSGAWIYTGAEIEVLSAL